MQTTVKVNEIKKMVIGNKLMKMNEVKDLMDIKKKELDNLRWSKDQVIEGTVFHRMIEREMFVLVKELADLEIRLIDFQ